MFRRILPLFLLTTIACSAPSYAQNCTFSPLLGAGTIPPQLISGRVIVPVAGFDKTIEVLLFSDAKLESYAYTNGNGEYKFPLIDPGRYYVVVRIEGFKEKRERIDPCDFLEGNIGKDIVNIFMDFDEPPIPFLVADYAAELNEPVNLAELAGSYSKSVVEEYKKAQSDRLSGFFRTAERRLQKLVTDVPSFYEAHILLGANYLDLKSYQQAEAEFNKAQELKPNSAVPLLALGSLYLVEIQAFTNPEPGDPPAVTSEDNIPLILDDARDVLERAAKIKTQASFVHYLLGAIHHKSGNYGRSEASYKKALELDPKLRWTRIALSNLYLRLGRLKDVVEQLDAYLKDYPNVQNRFDIQALRKRVAGLLPPEKK
jgi:tetratricopeptide (TPR) repeat protein